MSAIVLASTKNMPYDKWLDWRKKGIGGSDASVVCGINKYKSPVELWLEKTGQLPHSEAGESAYWGKRLESLVKDEFTRRTGIEVVTVNKLLRSKEEPFMIANLDGVCRSPEHGNCVFEAKTSSAYRAEEWNDGIPDEYELQIQHYMAVTGYTGAYVAVLIGGNTFKWKLIERDEELISMLIKWEHIFWEHIKSNVPPALDGSEASANYLKKRFPNSVPQSKVELPASALELIRMYEEAGGKGEEYSEQKLKAENQLKEMLGDNEIGVIGNRIITWKSVSQERIDGKALKAEQPTVYSQYANKSSYRRFSIKTAS